MKRSIRFFIALFLLVIAAALCSCTQKTERKDREKPIYYYDTEFRDITERFAVALPGGNNNDFRRIGAWAWFNNEGLWSVWRRENVGPTNIEDTVNIPTDSSVLYIYDYKTDQVSRKELVVSRSELECDYRSASGNTVLLGTLDDGTYVCAEFAV